MSQIEVGDEETRSDLAAWLPRAKVEKWASEEDYASGAEPYEVVEDTGNVTCVAGVTRIWSLVAGLGGQALDTTHARLGVGNGTTAVNSADANLTGPLRLFHGLDPAYPQVSGAVISYRAVFQASEANFTWNEWGIDVGGAGTSVTNGTVVAPLVNHRVPSPTGTLGTKVVGQVWIFTVTITLA